MGQSQNLKLRLSYYKNAQPEREPRKIIRLVHQTENISWECCSTSEAAALREMELIRRYRPKFNVALTLTPTYTFFGLRRIQSAMRLRIRLRNEPEEGEKWFGAFKNHGLCRRAYLALGRFIWAWHHPVTTVYDFPLWLHETTRQRDSTLPGPEVLCEMAERLLNGEGSNLLPLMEEKIKSEADVFLRKLWEQDLLTLTEFDEHARRFKVLREFHGIDQPVEQNDLDALAFKMRRTKTSVEPGPASIDSSHGDQ